MSAIRGLPQLPRNGVRMCAQQQLNRASVGLAASADHSVLGAFAAAAAAATMTSANKGRKLILGKWKLALSIAKMQGGGGGPQDPPITCCSLEHEASLSFATKPTVDGRSDL